jgi:hypothetical protein
MTSNEGQFPGWTKQQGELWASTLPAQVGEPDLILRVFPNQYAFGREDLWVWEIVDPCEEDETVEAQIDNGEASTREAAMYAAAEEASAHVARISDE